METRIRSEKIEMDPESEFVEPSSDEIKIPCDTINVQTCKERNVFKVYEGETGRSAKIMGAEHLRELEIKKDKSVL